MFLAFILVYFKVLLKMLKKTDYFICIHYQYPDFCILFRLFDSMHNSPIKSFPFVNILFDLKTIVFLRLINILIELKLI